MVDNIIMCIISFALEGKKCDYFTAILDKVLFVLDEYIDAMLAIVLLRQ